MTEPWPRDGLERLERCPVCDGADRELLYDALTDHVFGTAPGKWDVHRCVACRSAYLDPRPTAETIGLAYRDYFTHTQLALPPITLGGVRRALSNGYLNARYATRFDLAWPMGRFVLPFFPARRSRVDREVRHLLRPQEGATVLDVGCGDGRFVRRMKAAGWRAVGVDPDPRAVQECRRHGIAAVQGTMASLDAAPGTFDAVTLSHVIEHTHDPRAELGRARELLKPEGVLWLATPNLSARGHSHFGASWLGLDPPRHLVVFTRESLIRMVVDAGFRIVDQPAPAWSEVIYAISAQLAGRMLRGARALWTRPLVAHLAWRLRPDAAEEIILVATPA